MVATSAISPGALGVQPRWRRWTGLVGITYVVMQLSGVVLMLAAGNPPSFDDARNYAHFITAGAGLFTADAVLTGVATALLIIFVVGIRGIIRAVGEQWEWAAALAYGAALVVAALAFTGAALEATAAILSSAGADAELIRGVWAATDVVFTFIYLPGALLVAVVSFAALRTRVLPGWVGWLGVPCALLNLGAALTVVGGTGGYGSIGLLPVILGFAPAGIWVLGVSVAVLNLRPAAYARGAEPARSL